MTYQHQTYRTYQDFLVDMLGNLRESGSKHVSRAGLTIEKLNVSFTISHPLERFVSISSRKSNPFATLAETMWVMSGRNDMTFLQHYLPRAKEFSDDGNTWRAAYGPRLRNWHGYVDQVKSVIDKLSKDPSTRQAVIAIWDPAEDNDIVSKDFPCNNLITFQMRDRILYMSVAIRSQDIIWGSMINMFEWSVLQELVASSVGATVGPATYTIGSLHMYDRHQNMAEKILQEMENPGELEQLYYEAPLPRSSSISSIISGLSDFDDDLERFKYLEDVSRNGQCILDNMLLEDIVNPFVRDTAIAIDLYNEWQVDSEMSIDAHLEMIEGLDIRTAVYSHIKRVNAKKSGNTSSEQISTSDLNTGDPYKVAVALAKLQRDKSKVYGDSWKRHGELLSIFANISRKWDRIDVMSRSGISSTPGVEETLLDTFADIAVYLSLYSSWQSGETFTSEIATASRIANTLKVRYDSKSALLDYLNKELTKLEENLIDHKFLSDEEKLKVTRNASAASIMWICTK